MSGRSVEATVLIPTYNAGPLFAEVMEAISSQNADFGYEVLLVDSGSTDGTLELARRSGARVIGIKKSEFSHGGARNRGISEARGEFVAMTVQDATPADGDWLPKLVENLANDDTLAGAYSRQIPRPDCNPFTRHQLEQHFTNSPERRVQRAESPEAYEAMTPMQKLQTITFDDVASCVRRSVWREHPFRSVSFGEDLDWSERVVKAGYGIVYEPASAVIHSHDRSAFYEMKRAYVAHKLLGELVGLRVLPNLKALRRGVPAVARARLKLAANAGGGAGLYWRAIARSVGDQTGVFLGGLAGSEPGRVPGFLDRRLGGGV